MKSLPHTVQSPTKCKKITTRFMGKNQWKCIFYDLFRDAVYYFKTTESCIQTSRAKSYFVPSDFTSMKKSVEVWTPPEFLQMDRYLPHLALWWRFIYRSKQSNVLIFSFTPLFFLETDEQGPLNYECGLRLSISVQDKVRYHIHPIGMHCDPHQSDVLRKPRINHDCHCNMANT